MRTLVFAGLDPSGRAGLLADGEAIRAAGGTPVLCATGVAAQSADRLMGMFPVSPEALRAQAEGAMEDGPIGAVKIGMLGSVAVLETLFELTEGPLAGVPIVFDPVLATSRGGALFAGEASALAPLVAACRLFTPNLDEAEAFVGIRARDERAMVEVGHALARLGAGATLLKGGHLDGAPMDLLVGPEGKRWFRGDRLPSRRGTGCRLASGIAARLAAGQPLVTAIEGARAAVAAYLAAGARPL